MQEWVSAQHEKVWQWIFPYLLSATEILGTRVCADAHRQGPKRTSLHAVVQVTFLASRLIDRHNLDHLFCPLPKALQMTFHLLSNLLTSPPYYMHLSWLRWACESQTRASVSNSACGVHLGRCSHSHDVTVCTMGIGKHHRSGLQGVLLVWLLVFRARWKHLHCLTSSPPPLPSWCSGHTHLEDGEHFLIGLLLGQALWHRTLLPPVANANTPLFRSPCPFLTVSTGSPPPAARTDLSQGSALVTMCCQCGRPEGWPLRSPPPYPKCRWGGVGSQTTQLHDPPGRG